MQQADKVWVLGSFLRRTDITDNVSLLNYVDTKSPSLWIRKGLLASRSYTLFAYYGCYLSIFIKRRIRHKRLDDDLVQSDDTHVLLLPRLAKEPHPADRCVPTLPICKCPSDDKVRFRISLPLLMCR